MSVKFVRSSLAALVLAVAFSGPALADAAKQIEARQTFYKAVKVHMGGLVPVAKGQMKFSEETRLHAQGMLALAMQAPRMFPEGSDFGDTGAKPEIWENKAEFQAALDAFLKAAQMAAKADAGSIGAAVGGLGKSCKGCHDDFRQKN